MKKTIYISLSLILIIILIATILYFLNIGNTKNTNAQPVSVNTDVVEIYFTDQHNTEFKSEKLTVRENDINKKTRMAVEALLAGPTTPECKKIIAEGTKLLDLAIQNKVISLNLSKEYYGTSDVSDMLAAYSIVKTLGGINGIDAVNILVEGSPAIGPSKKPLGTLNIDDVVFDNPSTNKSQVILTLYFATEDGMSLAREERIVEVADKEPIEKYVVLELIAGPKNKDYYQTLPQGTKLKSIETQNGVCFVNLSGAFAANATTLGSSGEQVAIYSLTNSLTELPHIKKVQILVDGQKSLGHFDISEPFERSEALIKK